MNAITIGLEIAKSVFQAHTEDASGKIILHKRLRRSQVEPFFAELPPSRIGIETCGSAHHWTRERGLKLTYYLRSTLGKCRSPRGSAGECLIDMTASGLSRQRGGELSAGDRGADQRHRLVHAVERDEGAHARPLRLPQ